jgi:hypothetical protein
LTFLLLQIPVPQDRTVRALLAKFLVTAAQSRTQFALQLLQICQLLPNIRQLRLQAPPHRRTRLHSASAQIQKAPDFAELESQTLYATDEGQRFDITVDVLAKASRRPGRLGQQSMS